MTTYDWKDKVVLVTGSSSGIGEETAREFDRAGAIVVVNSGSSPERGREVADSLRAGHYIQSKVGTEDDARALIAATLATCGRLDVLVNNAGTTRHIPHYDVNAANLDVWREIFDVNVFGTWAVTVAALDALRETQGSIVNVSSIAGVRPTGSSIPYASSKAALNHMTDLLAKVIGPDVRINAVAPGLVDTPWTEDWDDVRAVVRQVAPLRRTATPHDVAQLIRSLAENTYMTGQVVVVDGGLTLTT